MRQRKLHDEERLHESDATPGTVVFGRVMSHPWWPAVIGRCPKSGTWQNDATARWVFFLNDDHGAWLKLGDIRPFGEWNKEAILELNSRTTRFNKYLNRIEDACQMAKDLVELLDKSGPYPTNALARFSPTLTSDAVAPIFEEDEVIDEGFLEANGASPCRMTPDSVNILPDTDEEVVEGSAEANEGDVNEDEGIIETVSPSRNAAIVEEVQTDSAQRDGRPKRKRTKSTRLNGFVDPNEQRTKPVKRQMEPEEDKQENYPSRQTFSYPPCPLRLKLKRDAVLVDDTESAVEPPLKKWKSLGADDAPDNDVLDNDAPTPNDPDEIVPVHPSGKSPKGRGKKLRQEQTKGKAPLVVRFKKGVVLRVPGIIPGEDHEGTKAPEATQEPDLLPVPRRSTRSSVTAGRSPNKTSTAGSSGAGPSKTGRGGKRNAPTRSTKGRMSPWKARNTKRTAPSAPDPEPAEAEPKSTADRPPKSSKRRRIGSARATVRATREKYVAGPEEDTETEDEQILMDRMLPTEDLNAVSNVMVGQNVSVMGGIPGQSVAANIHSMIDSWSALLNRMSAMENWMEEFKKERRHMELYLQSSDPASARFKASVESTHMTAKQFVESRNYDPAAIQRGINELWPPTDPGSKDRAALRQAAISHIWECYGNRVGPAALAREQETAVLEAPSGGGVAAGKSAE